MKKTINKIKISAFVIILLELFLLAAFTILYFNNVWDIANIIAPMYIVVGAVGLVILNCLFIWISVMRVSSIRNKTDLTAASVIGGDIEEAYNFAMVGLAITNDEDTVLWTNDLFRQRHLDIIDANILTWQPNLTLLKNNPDKNAVAKIEVNHRNYEVKYIQEGGLWIFKDNTDYESVYNYSKEQAPVVGLLSIDNYDDVMRGDDDSSDVITKLKNVIFNYAKDFGILLRRHKDDTYLVLCNYESFSKMKNDKFSILDKARQISKEEDIPLTLSIGIAFDFPDVVKLNEMASDALDIAMSRGGDQVAISAYGSEMEFFGGRTDAQEKRNRVKTRVLSDSLVQLIKNASNVLIMGHARLDMDSFGACLGVSAICERLEKKHHVVIDIKSTENKTRAAMLSQFSKEELDELVVSPNDATDLVEVETLLIVVDVHIPSMTMAPKLLDKVSKIVVLDHHRRGEDYIESPVFNHIDPTSSSTCELITEFIHFCSLSPKIEVSKTYATIMLSGIFLDSLYFKNKRTGVRTFEACTFLKEYGADNSLADDLLKDDYEEYQTINSVMSNIKTPHYGVVYALGDPSIVYDDATIAKIANTCLTLKGVHASFVLGKISSKEIKMSARSDGEINVQMIAEKLGGGGHYTLSAAVFDKSDLNEVEKMLVDVLDSTLKEAYADAKSRRDED